MLPARAAYQWIAALIVVAPVGRAAAYCVARGCDPDAPGGSSCRLDSRTGCSAEGVELFRPDGCMYFAVGQGAAERGVGLSDRELEDAIHAAFDTWASVECGEGHPSIVAQSAGSADIDRPFACAGSRHFNVDVWLVRDDLSMAVTNTSGATAGITHASIVSETGEVYDADVSLNALWLGIQRDEDLLDHLHVVALHEAGHALGLAHSRDEDALMYRNYRVSRERTLTQDDIDGICALYPPMSLDCPAPRLPASAIDAAACEARRAAADADATDDESASSVTCAAFAPGVKRGPATLLPLLAICLARWRARRKRRRRTLS